MADIPVYLIAGFLDGGKTDFINGILEDGFAREDKTLLICCEEGDTEYDPELLKKTNTILVNVESMDEISPERLTELELLHNPERVLMEWNGMWNQDELRLPKDWEVYQQITIIDGSTFDLYVKNMKPLLGAMVRNSELIICNRCDDVEDLEGYRRTLLAMNNQAEIVFEDAEGEISEISEADLPYDLSADVTVIAPEDFGIWYIDCMDKPDRYRGKVVEFTGMVMKSNKFPKNYFVPGRMAMTCCADDTAFIGFLCKSAYVDRIKSKQWLTVTAKAHIEKRAEYSGQEGLVLQSTNIKSAEKPEEELVYF